MKTVKVKGLSNHGKNRVSFWGDTWEVTKETPTRMLLQSVKEHKGEKWLRWIEKKNDLHFEIICATLKA